MAYDSYNCYAKDHGFNIRKDKFKRSKGPAKQIRQRHFLCSRVGERQPDLCTGVGWKCRLRPVSRCMCNAKLIVKLDKSIQRWVVHKFDDAHNRILATPDEVPFQYSHRRIKPHDRADILAMEVEGVRKTTIMRTYISRTGHWSKVGWVRKDVYNMCCRVK